MNLVRIAASIFMSVSKLYQYVFSLFVSYFPGWKYYYTRLKYAVKVTVILGLGLPSLTAVEVHELTLPRAVGFDVASQLSIFPNKPRSYLDLVIRLRVHQSDNADITPTLEPIAWAYLPRSTGKSLSRHH